MEEDKTQEQIQLEEMPKISLILSTRNPSKTEQIKAFFAGTPLAVSTLSDAGIDGEAIEDGATLEENAMKKARFAHEHSGAKSWTMADDTGLFITALDGEPGIYAARWAGDGVSTEKTMQYCLDRMKDARDRSAIFRTVVAIVSPDGKEYTFNGEVHGHILEAPRVAPQPKMPYSGLFVPDGQDLCWAEMTTEYENKISHRGKAFAQVRKFFDDVSGAN